MARKNATEEKEEKIKRQYSIAEIQQFQRNIEKYKREITRADGTTVMVLDWDTIYIKAGVKTEQPNGYAPAVVVQEKLDGSMYVPLVEFENLKEQWEKWRYGLEMGEKAKMGQLEKTAEEINSNDELNNW